MKSFETAVKTAEVDHDEPITFEHDGREVTAYPPEQGQMALMLSAIGKHSRVEESIAGAVDFFMETFDGEDKFYFRDRLLSRKDPFDLDDAMEIIEWLFEEWGAHPTKRPSGSASSRSRSGRGSTRTTQASA